VTFDAMTVPLIKGFTGVMHIGTLSEQITLTRLISQLNKGTGEVIKSKPRCLPKNSNGIVELVTLRPVCMEEFK
jgi:elongation factor 1 alpha-like protein